MKTALIPALLATSLAFQAAAPAQSPGIDWPQWRGPQRDGVWRETGLISDFPAEFKAKWSVPIWLSMNRTCVITISTSVYGLSRFNVAIHLNRLKEGLLLVRASGYPECFYGDYLTVTVRRETPPNGPYFAHHGLMWTYRSCHPTMI